MTRSEPHDMLLCTSQQAACRAHESAPLQILPPILAFLFSWLVTRHKYRQVLRPVAGCVPVPGILGVSRGHEEIGSR